jgi:hypothetical protein
MAHLVAWERNMKHSLRDGGGVFHGLEIRSQIK